MKARVYVMPKAGVLDPQGKARPGVVALGTAVAWQRVAFHGWASCWYSPPGP